MCVSHLLQSLTEMNGNLSIMYMHVPTENYNTIAFNLLHLEEI